MAGVPFAPGTEVAVTISPREQSGAEPMPSIGETGLRWQGNVLVHQGLGTDLGIWDLRDERLTHLAGGPAR